MNGQNYGQLHNPKTSIKKYKRSGASFWSQSYQIATFQNSGFILIGKLISTLWNFYPFALTISKEMKISLLKF